MTEQSVLGGDAGCPCDHSELLFHVLSSFHAVRDVGDVGDVTPRSGASTKNGRCVQLRFIIATTSDNIRHHQLIQRLRESTAALPRLTKHFTNFRRNLAENAVKAAFHETDNDFVARILARKSCVSGVKM